MILDDGRQRQELWLDRPEIGVMLPPMVWHEMQEMTCETVLLVLASEEFDPDDYIRDYRQFQKLINCDSGNES